MITILVTSGKGGVGKSTVSANLAIALLDRGLKVSVLDADLMDPVLHILFNCQKEALRESGNVGVDYAELNVNYEKNFDFDLPKIDDWDVRGFSLSKGNVHDRNYTLISFTRINDANPRFLISAYYRGSYEEISKTIQSLRAEMESINSFIIKIFEDGKTLIEW